MSQRRDLLFLTSVLFIFCINLSCDFSHRQGGDTEINLESSNEIFLSALDWNNHSAISIMGCREALQSPCFTPRLLMKSLIKSRDSVRSLILNELTEEDKLVYVSEYWNENELEYTFEICIKNNIEEECRACYGSKTGSYFLCDPREGKPSLENRLKTNSLNKCSDILNSSLTNVFLLSSIDLESKSVSVDIYPW